MTNSKHVPKRRFKEFELDDEWEQLKLGDHANILTGGTPNTSISSYWEPKEIPWMSSGEVNRKRLDKTDNMISNDGIRNSSARWVKKHSILIALAGQGKTRGMVAVNNIPLTTNQSVAAIEPDKTLNYEFVFQNLSKRYDELRLISSGDGSRGGLNKQIVSDISIACPNVNEQELIGNFLADFDSLITMNQHKLDKLKDLKKAYLTEMFPAEGERVPKRRFPGFEGEWEQKKLGQLMDVGSVKRVHQSDWRDRGVRFLRARDIVSESKNKRPDDFLYIDEELYKKYSAISGVVEKGDLLVTGVGTIGVPMLVESSEPLYFKDGNIIWFKNKNLLDGHFFYYSFTARAIQKFIGDVAGVGTVGTYTIDSGKNTPILLPVTKEEQVVIGDFFKKLDQSITLQQHKLDKLNDLKKAYLNELFV